MSLSTAKPGKIRDPPGLVHANAFQALHVDSEDEEVKNFLGNAYSVNFPDQSTEKVQKKKPKVMGNYSKKNPVSQNDRKKMAKSLKLFQKVLIIKELSPVIAEKSEKDGWTCVKGVMDSGASESVAPPSMCPEFPVTPSAGSKAGQNYISASDDLLPNLGEQVLEVVTDAGRDGRVRYQIADVTRPLNSISEICDAGGEQGQQVIFGKHGGSILNLETGTVTDFQREDGIYVMNMWVKPKTSDAAGFPRQS